MAEAGLMSGLTQVDCQSMRPGHFGLSATSAFVNDDFLFYARIAQSSKLQGSNSKVEDPFHWFGQLRVRLPPSLLVNMSRIGNGVVPAGHIRPSAM